MTGQYVNGGDLLSNWDSSAIPLSFLETMRHLFPELGETGKHRA
jgi:hypothetical protein